MLFKGVELLGNASECCLLASGVTVTLDVLLNIVDVLMGMSFMGDSRGIWLVISAKITVTSGTSCSTSLSESGCIYWGFHRRGGIQVGNPGISPLMVSHESLSVR